MPPSSELEDAFDAAIAQVEKCARSRMKAVGGESAQPYLQKLDGELKAERERALQRGSIDRQWFQATVRWLLEWVPETDLTLIAALGRVARAAPTTLS
jgi:hypothetical protein